MDKLFFSEERGRWAAQEFRIVFKEDIKEAEQRMAVHEAGKAAVKAGKRAHEVLRAT